jgi:hypothetical protein
MKTWHAHHCRSHSPSLPAAAACHRHPANATSKCHLDNAAAHPLPLSRPAAAWTLRPQKFHGTPTSTTALPSRHQCPGNSAVWALHCCCLTKPGHAHRRPFSLALSTHKHPDITVARQQQCRLGVGVAQPPTPQQSRMSLPLVRAAKPWASCCRRRQRQRGNGAMAYDLR